MRRISIWLAATAAGVALLFSYRTSTVGAPPTASAPRSRTSASTAAVALRTVADQVMNGPVIDTRWGPVQVAVAVAGGRIGDVKVLQVPSDNERDAEINDSAVPVLRQEALAAQSTQIDTVSGASYTSDGYRQSLQGALDKLVSSGRANAAPAQAAPATTAAAPSPSGPSRTVDGPVIDTRWGPFQVAVAIAGARIADVKVLQAPSESRQDAAINGYALPILVQEALAAQSANIDAVSGASYTSDGYTRSLQGALDAAGFKT